MGDADDMIDRIFNDHARSRERGYQQGLAEGIERGRAEARGEFYLSRDQAFAEGREAGRAGERAAVVAWLRSAGAGFLAPVKRTAIYWAADRIEDDDHMPKRGDHA